MNTVDPFAAMGRDLDMDGNIVMVGYIPIVRSEAEAQEAARILIELLKKLGSSGPLHRLISPDSATNLSASTFSPASRQENMFKLQYRHLLDFK